MEILYPLVRYLNIDARDIFNPERKQDTPCMKQLRVLIDGCTEHEAKALIPVIQAVCSVLWDRDTLEIKKSLFPYIFGIAGSVCFTSGSFCFYHL